MKKKKKKSKLEKLDEERQSLQKKLFQAHTLGMSYQVIQQIESMLDVNQLDLYTESEMEQHRREQSDDKDAFSSDDYIV